MRIQSSDKWRDVEQLFSNAVDLRPGSRAAYLDTCSTDPEIRAEVERLLRAGDNAGDFLTSLDSRKAAELLDVVGSTDDETFIGRYRVLREIGKGGMGVVYLAEDSSLKRRVAVKLLPPYLHSDSLANRRLLDEARAASALDHPNIATVHEIGETEDGRLFITMSYYEGETLRGRIERGPLAVDDALNIAGQIASGLGAAHRKSIIHRDIKPENILITADGIVKILDFGIAKVAGQALTQTGVAVGTAAYMSPEQTFGSTVDARTDLWSLGVVMYEMLAGERPFRGDRQDAVLFAIRSDPPQISAQLSKLSPGLTSILDRCLQKTPEDRYQSAEAVAEDLARIRSGSVDALNATLFTSPRAEPIPDTPRRIPWLPALIVAAVIVVAGGLLYRGLGSRRAPAQAANATVTGTTGAQLASDPSEQGSIAVLPFASVSSSRDLDYIGDGITDELIHALSRMEKLRVVSRTSSFQFKGKNVDIRDVGAKLGVTSVLEGTVRSGGDSLRVTVRLIDARNGYELWSEVFDKPRKDIFDVQEQIARAVVEKLQIRVTDRTPARLAQRSTEDPEAYSLYLKGRQLWNERRNLEQSIKYFEQSIRRDPKFALAHLALGQAWIILPFYDTYPLQPAHEKARAAILKALAIDSTMADAYGSLGSMEADSWRWKEAEKYFQRALALSGGDATTRQWYGEMLLKSGRLDDAIRELRVARRLNPLSAIVVSTLGFALYSAGQYDEALAAFRSARGLNPSLAHSYVGVGVTYVALGRPADAIVEFKRGMELRKGDETQAHMARSYLLTGRNREAEQLFAGILKRAEDGSGSPWAAALVAVWQGRNNEALGWLEKSYDIREFELAYIRIEPTFKTLSAEPRFIQLLRKMGFDS